MQLRKRKCSNRTVSCVGRNKQKRSVDSPPDQTVEALLQLYNAGDLSNVVKQAQALTRQYPEAFIVWNLLGAAAAQTGRLDQAVDAFQKVISIKPHYVDGYNNLATALTEQGKLCEARTVLEKALEKDSDHPETYFNLGNTLTDQSLFDDAIIMFEKVTELKPDHAEAHNNMGYALYKMNRYAEAESIHLKAIEIRPTFSEAYYNLGSVFSVQARSSEAVSAYRKAIEIQPEYPEAHLNLSFLLLKNGDIREGLDHHEWRWKMPTNVSLYRHFSQPAWDGVSSLEDKTILIWAEQGIGDTLNWSAFLPLILSQSKRCILECPAKLVPLLSRSFPEVEVRSEDRSRDADRTDFDVHLPIGSLHRQLLPQITEETQSTAFLTPDPERVSYWAERLRSLGDGPYIGIGWKSSEMSLRRVHNYAPLSDWSPLLTLSNVTFVNLQYKDFEEDLRTIRDEFGVTVHNFEDLDLFDDLDDVAALCAALDIVVSTTCAVPFISAGVGTATKLASWKQSAWNNRLFYPNGSDVEKFERNTWEPWETVFQTIANNITKAPESLPDQTVEALLQLYNAGDLSNVVKQAQALTRQYPEAFIVWNLLGAAAAQTGRLDQAVDAFQKVISIKPDYVDGYNNLGNAISEQGKFDDAIYYLRKAIELQPDFAEVHFNIGNIFHQQQKHYEAITAYRKALTLNPKYCEAYYNIADALSKQAKLSEAIAAYRKALEFQPDYYEAHVNLSYLLLKNGDIREGLDHYEWRWKSADNLRDYRGFTQPAWDGVSSLEDKTILIWAEQGIGDTLNWSAFLPLILSQSKRCILECPAKLVPLLSRSFPEVEVRSEDRSRDADRTDFDVHLPIGSLHRQLLPQITEETQSTAFLTPDPERVSYWAERLRSLGDGPYIGIGWKSSEMSLRRVHNYAPLSDWSPLLTLSNVTFVNLQYKDFEEDLRTIRDEFGVTVHNFEDLDLFDDLDDVAALCAALDIVVSTTCAVPFISAGVGTATKLASWKQSAWNNRLFYPNGSDVEKFERNTWEPWETVFQTIANNITKAPESLPDQTVEALLQLYNAGDLSNVVKQAQALTRQYPEAFIVWNLLGAAAAQTGRLDQAVDAFQKVISIKPDYVDGYNNLGNAISEQGKFDDAIYYLRKATELQPDFAEAHFNMGNVLGDQGKPKEAFAAFEKALSINSDYPEVHLNLSFLLLKNGDIREGLDQYEWRWKMPTNVSLYRHFLQPAWDGVSSLEDKTILIWAEQGIGDTLNWSAFLPLILSQSKHCILECPAKLVPLLSRSFPEVEVRSEDRSRDADRTDFDVHLPIGSLHRQLLPQITEETQSTAFLTPDPERVSYWAERLRSLGDGPYIGIGWKSSEMSLRRVHNYAPLSDWSPLLTLSNVTFVNLQYKDFEEDLRTIRDEFGVTVHNFEDLDLFDDLDDVAALCAALDIVVSTTCAVPFISAGVGTATKLASWKQSAWNNRLFYPNGSDVEKFERNTWEPWETVFQTIAENASVDFPVVCEELQKKQNILDNLKLDKALRLAEKHTKSGHLDEAKCIYQDVLVKFPQNKKAIKALNHLSKRVHNQSEKRENPPEDNLHKILDLYSKGHFQEALNYSNLLAKNFNNSPIIYNMQGAIYKSLGQFEFAIEAFKKAVRIKSDYDEAFYNMGRTLEEQAKFHEAITAYNHALRINPTFSEAYYNLGSVFSVQARSSEAVSAYRKAIEIQPEYPEAHLNLSFLLLKNGDIREGLDHHEWRWKMPTNVSLYRHFSQPAWDGVSSLEDKTILIWAEQGIGDTLNWSAFLPLILSQSKRCILECPAKLVPLLSRSFPEVEVRSEDRSRDADRTDFDVHLPIGSLHRQLLPQITEETQSTAFLTPDPERVSYWAERLRSLGDGPYIGIGWKSSEMSLRRVHNYAPLSDWSPLLTLSNVTFVNLQYKDFEEDLRTIRDEFGVTVHNFEDLDLFDDLDDVAALCAALDIVVSTTCAVPFISAGVGTATKLASWKQSAWNNRLFYPNGSDVEKFERNTWEPWETVFQTIANNITKAPESLPDQTVEALLQLYNAGDLSNVVKQAQALTRQYPEAFIVWNLLGAAAAQTGRLDQAVDAFQKVISIKPDYADAYNNLGNILSEQGRIDEAILAYEKTLSYDLLDADAYNNLGHALHKKGKYDAALDACKKSLQIKPQYVEAYNNIGNIFRSQKKFDEAVASFTKATEINPKYSKAYWNIGHTYRNATMYDEALEAYKKAHEIDPDFSEAYYNNVGNIYCDQGKLEEAVKAYNKALEVTPNYADKYYNNMGNIYGDQGNLVEAVEAYRKALDIRPDYSDAHLNLSFSLLKSGTLKDGLNQYEWRWKSADNLRDYRGFTQPAWDGVSSLEDKTILIWAEQGIGDTLNWSAFLPLILSQSKHCILECPAKLVPLLSRSFPEVDVRSEDRSRDADRTDFDVHLPMGSLFRQLLPQITEETQSTAFLTPDPKRVSYWAERLRSLGDGPYIGIGWKSSGTMSSRRAHNYAPLSDWSPLLTLSNVTFVNLQYKDFEEDLRTIRDEFGVTVHNFEDLDLFDDLDDVAALCAALDIVVSTTCAVPFISAGVGTATKLASWKQSAWNNRLFYPNGSDVEKFERNTWEPWEPVFQTIANNITKAPESPPDQTVEALLQLYNAGDLSNVVKQAQALARQYPEAFIVWNLLGAAAAQTGRLDQAVDAFQKVISIKPDYAAGYENLANALTTIGEFSRAVTAYKKAIEIQPEYARCFLELERLLLQLFGESGAFVGNASFAHQHYNFRADEQAEHCNNMAIFHFLHRDYALSEKYLAKLTTHFDHMNAISKNERAYRYYYDFLTILISKLVTAKSSSEHNIYHIGESHCLTMAHHEIITGTQSSLVIPVHTMGAQAHHFSQSQPNKIKAITKHNLDNIPQCSQVFISIGEIDCRPQTGIIEAARKSNSKLEQVVKSTVIGFVKWFISANNENQHYFRFFNIPAPTYKREYTEEENQRAANVVKLFNESLLLQLRAYSIKLIDVYSFTRGEDGFSNNLYHCDKWHLDDRIIPEIQKQLN